MRVRLSRAVPTCVGLLLLGAIGFSADAGTVQGTEHALPEVGNQEDVRSAPNASTGSCGVERWSVKTGTDADAGKLDVGATTATTIASLTSIPAPGSVPSNNRLAPVETTVFS